MESPNGQNLTIAGGQATPEILADWAEGLLAMAGESYPESMRSGVGAARREL